MRKRRDYEANSLITFPSLIFIGGYETLKMLMPNKDVSCDIFRDVNQVARVVFRNFFLQVKYPRN